jgi:hypothetical protein
MKERFDDMFQHFRPMAMVAFILLCFTAQASATFEVSPDHFDATPAHVQKTIQHAKTVRRTVAAKQPATGVGTGQNQLTKNKRPAAQQNISAQAGDPQRR